MSEAQKEAQRQRRERERQASSGDSAAAAANAAASRAPDGPIEFQPDPGATADAFSGRKKDDGDAREFKRGNPTRNAAYDEIIAARKTRTDDAVHEEPRPAEASPARQPQASQPSQPAAEPAPVVEQAPQPEMVRVKIDRQEIDVPKAEVDEIGGVKAYQMTRAAENRLREAKEQTSALTKMFEMMQRQAQPPREPEKTPAEQYKDLVLKIQLGTPEEGAAALAEALQRAIPKPPDRNQAAAEALLMFQVSQAEEAFIKANSDLVTNPMLKNLVIMEKGRRLEELRKQNRLPDDWNQFYTSIAVDVRSAIGRPPTTAAPAQTPASQPTSGLAEKEARKASISVLPTAAARAVAPEADKPLTRDDILARARQSRGQPT